MFGSEDHVLGPDLQDGRRLQGSGDGKERQLGRDLCSVFLPMVLSMEKLQSALNAQRLQRQHINVEWSNSTLPISKVTSICTKAHFGSNLSEERFTSSEYLSKDNHPLTIWQVQTHQEA